MRGLNFSLAGCGGPADSVAGFVKSTNHFSSLITSVMRRPVLVVLLLACGAIASAGHSFVRFRERQRAHSGLDLPARLAAATPRWTSEVLPLLRDHCWDCHGDGADKGGVNLDGFTNATQVFGQRVLWERVMDNVKNGSMPPPKKKQPAVPDREKVVAWLEEVLYPMDPANPDPGRVTIRRLNRTEYNNTVRDLLGVDFKPADDFPQDDVGYGFDNIGDVLSMPPVLLEKYLAAADRILAQAIVVPPAPRVRATRLDPKTLEGPVETYVGATGTMRMITRGVATMRFSTTKSGEHRLRVHAAERISGAESARLEVRVNGNVVHTAAVNGTLESPTVLEFGVRLSAGSSVALAHIEADGAIEPTTARVAQAAESAAT